MFLQTTTGLILDTLSIVVPSALCVLYLARPRIRPVTYAVIALIAGTVSALVVWFVFCSVGTSLFLRCVTFIILHGVGIVLLVCALTKLTVFIIRECREESRLVARQSPESRFGNHDKGRK